MIFSRKILKISAKYYLKSIDSTVVYVLEVPKDKVIYFDEMKWDYVLNRIYLPKDEEDAVRYEKHLKQLGVSDGFSFFVGKYKGMFPDEEERIRKIRYRAFEIDEFSPFRVSGNIWEIKKEWVKKIVYPGGRIPEDNETL